MKPIEISPRLKIAIKSLDPHNIEGIKTLFVKHLKKMKNEMKRKDLIFNIRSHVESQYDLNKVIKFALDKIKDDMIQIDLYRVYYLNNFKDESFRKEMEMTEAILLEKCRLSRYRMIEILYYAFDVRIFWGDVNGIERIMRSIVECYQEFGAEEHPIRVSYLARFDTTQISTKVLRDYLEICLKFFLDTSETY